MSALEDMSKTTKSNAVKEAGGNVLKDVIGIFMRDPIAAWSLTKDLKSLPSAIRDGIFWECLETFILHAYNFNSKTSQFEAKNLQSLAAALAEASPNAESGYGGDQDKLVEYAKRLIKLIDDCGTKQKAYYLACITRALLSNPRQIDTKKFFQLSRCVRTLTEEDLSFLGENIKEGNISRDKDYIDDYRALGLLYETKDGFSYSKRAFELKKYALCYETHIEIPDSFPPKYEPLIAQPISHDEIQGLVDKIDQVEDNQKWKTFM